MIEAPARSRLSPGARKLKTDNTQTLGRILWVFASLDKMAKCYIFTNMRFSLG